jgi:outer membrane protein assembly factor BamB
MRLRTAAVAAAVVATLVAVAVVAAPGAGGDLAPLWTSDTGRDVSANHHAPAYADGTVYAPVSSDDRTAAACSLYALDAGSGAVRWRYAVPAANCTIHAIADPTIADADGDGAPEVLAATTEREVAAFDPATGEKRRITALPTYGYTRPIVADLTDDPGRETVVVDTTGTVVVVTATGDRAWTVELGAYTFAQPIVGDVDADGTTDVLVATRDGEVTLLSGTGERVWTRRDVGTVSWATSGNADDDPALEVVLATIGGDAIALDGTTGEVAWRVAGGDYAFASVHAFGDGDGDGDPETYVATRDGRVAAVDAATGAVEWRTTVVAERLRMIPPPSLADVDGDGDPELVAPANDGTVSLLDPATGDVIATYGRDAGIYTHATVADVDGDGDDEAIVIYADGRVAALDYRG